MPGLTRVGARDTCASKKVSTATGLEPATSIYPKSDALSIRVFLFLIPTLLEIQPPGGATCTNKKKLIFSGHSFDSLVKNF